MKWFFKLMLPALVLASCADKEGSPLAVDPLETGERPEVVSHGMIELGDELDNPYSVTNMSAALAGVYPTRAAVELAPTDLYVRFLPGTADDFDRLQGLGVELFDYPLDREILTDGDYYHDPTIPAGEISWQYSVVPAGFEFPEGIRHEVLENCFIPDDDVPTKGLEDVDWDAVERRSFEATGNGAMLPALTRAKTKSKPSGRITIVDDKLGKAVGVAGVKMVANVFVKVSTTYTDVQGNYSFPAKFSAKPKYSICFQNKLGFTIGMNLVLVPASVSTIGKDDPEGVDVTINSNSDNVLFRRCVVNNAAYDYFQACSTKGITAPPRNLRFWILNSLRPSSALMMHQGAIIDTKLVGNFLDVYRILIQVFVPDITIGSKDKNGKYADLYSTAIHELAHASHFSVVKKDYWNTLATYVLSSYILTGSCYGSDSRENSGYCAVAEMWAYYVGNKFYKDRYGANLNHGYGLWFHPEILMSLDEGGISMAQIFSALTPSVTESEAFKDELISVNPSKKSLIESSFRRNTR